MSLPRVSSQQTFRKAAAYAHSAGVLAAALALSGCIFGGTGTDTENNVVGINKDKNVVLNGTGISARVVDSTGAPLAGVSLNLFDPLFRPDSSLPPVAIVANPAESLVSDTAGYVSLSLKAAGKFVVSGSQAGRTLFYDTLAIAELGKPALFTFRSRAVKAFQGKARLASGMRIDSGWVFVRGTNRAVKVDTAGNYDLGLLPSDVGRMAVGLRFASRPVEVRRAVPASLDTAKHEFVCKDVPQDSLAKGANPAYSVPVGMQTDAAAKLDSGTVNPALQSCDSLTKGSVITVSKQPEALMGTKVDSVPPAALLVLSGEQKVPSVQGTRIVAPVVVSLSQCVPNAGVENTTFDLQVQSTSLSSDILVKDVAAKCLEK